MEEISRGFQPMGMKLYTVTAHWTRYQCAKFGDPRWKDVKGRDLKQSHVQQKAIWDAVFVRP